LIDRPLAQAVRLDAACVCVNLFDIPGLDALRRTCVENISRLRKACDHTAVPLMVEPLVMKPGERGFGIDGDPARIATLVREAAELGTDIVKADPTDDLAEYHRVIDAARVPVFVR
jgi:fructose-bisphosphate aldolase, class I